MIIKADKKTYDVTWRHCPALPGVLRYTNCTLSRRLVGRDNWGVIAQATAHPIGSDIFSKSVGRKVSFSKCLAVACNGKAKELKITDKRAWRTKMWKAYAAQMPKDLR